MKERSGSPGLVVMGEDSWAEGCGFEAQHQIQDGHFSHIFVVKIVMFIWKDEKNEKEAGDENKLQEESGNGNYFTAIRIGCVLYIFSYKNGPSPVSFFVFYRKKTDRTEQKSKARKRSLERIRTGSVVVTAFFTARYVQLKLFVRRRLDEGWRHPFRQWWQGVVTFGTFNLRLNYCDVFLGDQRPCDFRVKLLPESFNSSCQIGGKSYR